MGLGDLFTKYMGIDLGTANTLVYVKDKGIILREPSVVAIDLDSGNVLAVGEEAKLMLGRTPGNIVAIRPLKDGVIADFEITHKMLRYFMKKAYPNKNFLSSIKVVVGVPSGVTEVEKRAVINAAISAGAKEALLLEEPMAAAIGSGLPVAEANGSMIVDIGGGTTEVAVISLGGIVVSRSIRVAGDAIDNAIINHIKKEYSVMIGDRTAEKIKVEIGSVFEMKKNKKIVISGKNLLTGLPVNLTLDSEEVREALLEPVTTIIEGIKSTLEKTPPELSSDIMLKGITLTGGGAFLLGFDKLIEKETNMPVHIAENPLDSVANGTGKSIESYKILKNIFLQLKRDY